MFEDTYLATGEEELSINALQQTKHRHLRSPLGRHHHAFGLRRLLHYHLLLEMNAIFDAKMRHVLSTGKGNYYPVLYEYNLQLFSGSYGA